MVTDRCLRADRGRRPPGERPGSHRLTAVGGLATSVKGAITNSREVKAKAVDVKDVAKARGRRLKRALKSYWSEIRGAPRSRSAAGRRSAATAKKR